MNVLVPGGLITARQIEFLALAARGFTQAEIANLCFVKPDTVQKTIDAARERLGARTTTQAVAIAVSLELITVEFDQAV